MEIGITKLSTRGQVVIPNNIREHLGLDYNEQFVVISDNEEIILKPVKKALNIKRKKSKSAEEFIKAMRHDLILSEMEKGKELSAETRKEIDAAIKKTIREYGEVLRLLGRE